MSNDFTRESFTLLAIALIVILFRTVFRIVTNGIRSLYSDDCLMLVAAVVYIAETITAHLVGTIWHGLANNGMTAEQRATLSPNSAEYTMRIEGSKAQLIGWSLYTSLLWLVKLCMCMFYYRLTDGVQYLRLQVHAGCGLLLVTYISTILSIQLGCMPYHRNWQINPDPGNHCQPAVSRINLFVVLILNIVTDIYLFTIPVRMLWSIQLSRKKRLSVLVLFAGGIFVIVAGIVRCTLIIADPINGASVAGSWAVRETFVAVLVTNIPVVYQAIRCTTQRILTSSGGRSRTESRTDNLQSTKRGPRVRVNSTHEMPWLDGSGSPKDEDSSEVNIVHKSNSGESLEDKRWRQSGRLGL